MQLVRTLLPDESLALDLLALESTSLSSVIIAPSSVDSACVFALLNAPRLGFDPKNF
jgi:hypothetical protein